MSRVRKYLFRFNDPAGSDFKFKFPDGREILLHQSVFRTKYFKSHFKYPETVANSGEHIVMDSTKVKYETVYPICQSFYGLEPQFQFPKDIVLAVDYLLSFAYCVEMWRIGTNDILLKFLKEFHQHYKPENTGFNQIFFQLKEVVKANKYDLMYHLREKIYQFIENNSKNIPVKVFAWKFFDKFDSKLVVKMLPFIKSVTEEEFDHMSQHVNIIFETKFSECKWDETIYLAITNINPFEGYLFEKIGNINGIAKNMGQKPEEGARYGICVFNANMYNTNDIWTVSGKEIIVHSYINMIFGTWYYLEENGVYPLIHQNIYKKTLINKIDN